MAEETVVTQEEINTLLMELFVNMNNLDRTYYDMFYNSIPMDIQIQRYDNNGVLQTYTVPNRAKDNQTNGVIIIGNINPQGSVPATAGKFYLNISTKKMYYKASGGSNDSSNWVEILSGIHLNSLGALPVTLGGTGNATLDGLLKGNGTQPIETAMDKVDYMSPNSVAEEIEVHNTSSTAHNNLVRRLSTTNATGNTEKPVYVDENGKVQECTLLNCVGFPDYSTTISLTNGGVTTQNCWVHATLNIQRSIYRPGGEGYVVINGKTFTLRHAASNITGTLALGDITNIMLPVKRGSTVSWGHSFNVQISVEAFPMLAI